jgi:hypothetical protein
MERNNDEIDYKKFHSAACDRHTFLDDFAVVVVISARLTAR